MTVKVIFEFVYYLQWAGSFLICLSCLPLYKYRKSYIKVLFFYGLTSILFQLGQQISIEFFGNKGINEIGDGFVFFEAILLSFMFWVVINDVFFRKIILAASILYIAYYFIDIFFFFSNYRSLIRSGREVLMMFFSISYFFSLIKNLPEENLLRFPMFWINSAVLFFFAGTFILSLMLDYIVFVLGDKLSGFWAFRNFFRFTFCLVLTYAGWIDWRLLKSRKGI